MESIINSRFENHLIDNREIRIFLSSTLADMEAERSALEKLFNKLKLEANQRNVALSLLDLRWGVTEEESRTGKVLSVCLNEIENSHPFFIGLLGSRYGFSPNASELEMNPDLKDRFPWLQEDINQKLSITEIEMQYGVLRNKEGIDACFFIKDTPDTLPDDNEKLTSLKNNIRGQQRFPVSDYRSIDDLCQQVETVVLGLLDKYFSDNDNTRLGRERNIQRAYMNSRHRFYIPRLEDFDRLNQFLDSDERHLVVTGPSGIGKSALITNWIISMEKNKDCPYNIIYHFVGNTFGGNGKDEVLQHISVEIFMLYKGLEVKLGNYESPEEKAQRYMTEAAQKDDKPMLIVIDGVNQIADRQQAKLLNWLPQSPRKVKYLFSTLEDDATMHTFFRLDYPIYPIGSLSIHQRCDFIVDYLSIVGKKLDENQIERILESTIVENTLVLKTLLDELICFGSYERLNERIDYYLSALSISDFFDRMLQRLEEDYVETRHLLSLIAVSEHGLSEDEIVGITGMRQIDFHLLYCAISAHLVSKGGLLVFAHQYITDAIVSRYQLQDVASSKPYREEIIHYFSLNEVTDGNRKISELSFQYYHLEDCENLYNIILSFDAFNYFNASIEGVAKLASYWRTLLKSDSEKYQLRDYIDLPFEGIPVKDLPYLYLGDFSLNYFADYKTSLIYAQTYLLMASFSGERLSLDIATSYTNIGDVYESKGDFSLALECYQNALEIQEEALGPEHLSTATTYNNIGLVYKNKGEYDQSLKFYKKALEIDKKAFLMEHPNTATIFGNIGELYRTIGNYDWALECFQKMLDISEKTLGIEHLNIPIAYNNMGLVYDDKGDYDLALKYYQNALYICKKILGLEHPYTAASYNNIGLVYSNKGDYDLALEYFQNALEIVKKGHGQEYPYVAMVFDNIGEIYRKKDDYDQALYYFNESLEIREKVLGEKHYYIAMSYNNIGHIYCDKRDYDCALDYYQKALDICEKALGLVHPYTATSISNIGEMYRIQGEYHRALEYHMRALEITEKKLGVHRDTAISYCSIGKVYECLCDLDIAMECYKTANIIFNKVLGPEHPYTKYNLNNIILLQNAPNRES